MLPYLKHEKEGSASLSTEKLERRPDEQEYDSLEVAAEDLMQAIQSKNIKNIASALRAAFDLCGSQPHEEEQI